MTLHFDNSYARLPDRFFSRTMPLRSPSPKLIHMNGALAVELGLDPIWLSGEVGLEILSGRSIAEGSDPIATVYAGHQFGNFVPQLGDGRAILLGEIIDRQGRRRDMQLKGSGRTPYSRGGDGRAALGPVLREYVISESMAALGVATTRALAAVSTGEPVYREGVLPGAILTRIASSHIRVGTFQYYAARGDAEGLRALADHVIARHYPETSESPRPYRALLDRIVQGQADLIASWMLIGFIHGVMNTDNMSIACETIDYGPCAFLDAYHPDTVFSSIDRAGRYAYANQPRIGLWNLTRLAETMLPLLNADENAAIAEARDSLAAYKPRQAATQLKGFRAKLGLFQDHEDDAALVREILDTMARNQVDFTLFFRRLSDAVEPETAGETVRELFVDPTAADKLLNRWRQRLGQESGIVQKRRALMTSTNPAFIPRNHHIEEMIRAAVTDGDFAPFERLLSILSRPFEDQPDHAGYGTPPLEHERVLATYCGT